MSAPQASRIPILISAAFLIVGSLVVVGAWLAYFTDAGIEQYGSRASGVVVKKEAIRSADGDSDFSVAYRFQLPNGEVIHAQRNLPKALWNDLQPGGTVSVLYSSEDPGRNFPEGGGVTSILAPILATLVFGGLAGLGGVVLAGLYRARASKEA